jgi:hypothetical protein
MALQIVPDYLSHMQRQSAMTATILHRDHRARLGAVQHNRFVADCPRKGRATEFGRPCGGVPVVLQEHRSPRQ